MMCVDCGAESERLIGGSCASCFTDRTPLMAAPEVVNIELCAHCGAQHVGAHWQGVAEDTPEAWQREDAARAAVGVHEQVEDPALFVQETEKDTKTFEMTVRMQGHVQGVPVSSEKVLLLRRTNGVCDRCSRIQGGYYAAIIQLRATERDVTPGELERAHHIVADELERQQHAGNREAFLSKSNPIHGGYDYYIGDIDAGRNISRRLKDMLGATMHESAKLVGRREGEDVYRVTFLVRVQPFTSGDIVVHQDRIYRVVGVHPKSLSVIDLETFRKDRLSGDPKRLGGDEILEWAVVVHRDADGVQILDPRSQQTVTVLVPPGDPVGEELPVVRHEDRLYYTPGVRATNNP